MSLLLYVSHKNLWMFQNQQPLNTVQYITILEKSDRSKLNYTSCWTAVYSLPPHVLHTEQVSTAPAL